jgi:tRNA uridine 5-carboxymethylaminomethyl modification enzyme
VPVTMWRRQLGAGFEVARASRGSRGTGLENSRREWRALVLCRWSAVGTSTSPQGTSFRNVVSWTTPTDRDFDVIVIGGGHAGTEAASAAARLGASVALVTPSPLKTIGEMSCNPSIGGLAKGALVKEIDALDGLMGIAGDAAGIQFRVLNSTKGPAVRGPRAQMDRTLYKKTIQSLLSDARRLVVVDAAVRDLTLTSESEGYGRGKVSGVTLDNGTTLKAPTVVVCTGTFLRGVIRVGTRPPRVAGRVPTSLTEKPDRTATNAAHSLSKRLYDSGFTMGRMKTGTPPRLCGTSIDWSDERLTKQVRVAFPKLRPPCFAYCLPVSTHSHYERLTLPFNNRKPGDASPTPFAFANGSKPGKDNRFKPIAPQIPCYATRTTTETELIVASAPRSPHEIAAVEFDEIFGSDAGGGEGGDGGTDGGKADGSEDKGGDGDTNGGYDKNRTSSVPSAPSPRYCPSLETKVRRFPGRSHLVWLEPEGIDTDVVYPNGLSCSLEPETQEAMLRTIPGLENVKVLKPGYASRFPNPNTVCPHKTDPFRSQPQVRRGVRLRGPAGVESDAGD